MKYVSSFPSEAIHRCDARNDAFPATSEVVMLMRMRITRLQSPDLLPPLRFGKAEQRKVTTISEDGGKERHSPGLIPPQLTHFTEVVGFGS